MKTLFNQAVLALPKLNKTHLQFALMLISLVMLVIGAGAPEDIGGSTR